jgi:hypothetical protein
MDPAQRASLEERRRFMRERNEARAFRAAIEPAWTALERSGENFRIYRLGSEPSWCPDWIPRGYSYIPWRELEGVSWSADQQGRGELAAIVRQQLAARIGPDEGLLFVAEGKAWSIGITRKVFDHHAEALLEAAWDHAFIAAPPARWLVFADGHRAMWKDG